MVARESLQNSGHANGYKKIRETSTTLPSLILTTFVGIARGNWFQWEMLGLMELHTTIGIADTYIRNAGASSRMRRKDRDPLTGCFYTCKAEGECSRVFCIKKRVYSCVIYTNPYISSPPACACEQRWGKS